ncbi:MAG: hypothetical protein JWN82_437 [Candidatus Saccharibacteria bacterium]|nr:hypothetical protein [Candidatus Saccharibacteria bacterium]
MHNSRHNVISLVIPFYNEVEGLASFDESLRIIIKAITGTNFEIVYCDDGSTDGSYEIARRLCEQHPGTLLLRLSRNFGKELAIAAGIEKAQGDAIIMLDADGQHPVECIPEFISKWQAGAKVVVGIRSANQREGVIKRWGSKLFYASINRLSNTKLIPNSTDFRLIDKVVQQNFVALTEHNRVSRALIDWLGYERDYITFKANPRLHGQASYSFKKLSKLGIDSVISLSISPLYIAVYLGLGIMLIASLLGGGMVVNWLLSDPLSLHATGGAYIMVLLLLLVGTLLVAQGIVGLYLSHIHAETQNRPLFVIDTEKSVLA